MERNIDSITARGIETGKLLSALWQANGIVMDVGNQTDNARLFQKVGTHQKTLESIVKYAIQRWSSEVQEKDLKLFYAGVVMGISQSRVPFGFILDALGDLPGHPKFRDAAAEDMPFRTHVFSDRMAKIDFLGDNETGELMVQLMLDYLRDLSQRKNQIAQNRTVGSVVAAEVVSLS
jgi:hypothetical protein